MILGDAVSKLQTFVWILSHFSRSITWSLYTLKESNDQSEHDLSCGGVSLSINRNFKLAPVPAEFRNGQFGVSEICSLSHVIS